MAVFLIRFLISARFSCFIFVNLIFLSLSTFSMELTELDEKTTTRFGVSYKQPTDLEESKEPEDPVVAHKNKISGIFESSFYSNVILSDEEKALAGLGFSLGTVGSIYNYPLALLFGYLACDWIGISGNGKYVASVILASVVLGVEIALGSVGTMGVATTYFKKSQDNADYPEVRYAAKGTQNVFALISATNLLYSAHLAYQNKSLALQLGMGIPGMICAYMYLSKYNNEFIDSMISTVAYQFKGDQKKVEKNQSKRRALKIKFVRFFKGLGANKEDYEAFFKVNSSKTYFEKFMEQNNKNDIIPSDNKITQNTRTRLLSGVAGAILGGACTIVSDPLNAAAFTFLVSLAKNSCSDIYCENARATFAGLACLSWAMLNIKATVGCSVDWHDMWVDPIYAEIRSYEPYVAIPILSWPISFVSTFPWAYVLWTVAPNLIQGAPEVKHDTAYALMGSAFLSTTAVRVGAVKDFIWKVIRVVPAVFKVEKYFSTSQRYGHIREVIGNVNGFVDNTNDETIDSLYEAIMKTESVASDDVITVVAEEI
jgi:hypothetical protein